MIPSLKLVFKPAKPHNLSKPTENLHGQPVKKLNLLEIRCTIQLHGLTSRTKSLMDEDLNLPVVIDEESLGCLESSYQPTNFGHFLCTRQDLTSFFLY